jgi:hypothetical protein
MLLKAHAALGLLPEADAFQIVNILNIEKLTGSA